MSHSRGSIGNVRTRVLIFLLTLQLNSLANAGVEAASYVFQVGVPMAFPGLNTNYGTKLEAGVSYHDYLSYVKKIRFLVESGSISEEQGAALILDYVKVEMKKCYDTYGCFSINYPWSSLKRPVTLFPESPGKINPNYCLYTRRNPTECQQLRLGDSSSVFRSNLMADEKMYFISHGYLETANKTWIQKMVSELLKKDDVNVVTVDWIGGSGPTYTQAVSNIRLVGVMTAHLIKLLMEESGVNPEKIHLIGHSLGSHLSGYVGHKMKEYGARIGRITGMDPADPQFDGTDPMVRLDPEDALFVDVIHTDTRPFVSGGFGLAAPIGHIDVYPNGGEYQPGCDRGVFNYVSKEKGSIIEGMKLYIGCNHIRSYEYFTESINSECPFAAVECTSYEDYLAGKCFNCESHGVHPELSTSFTGSGEHGSTNKTWCTRMGFHAVDPYLIDGIPTIPPRSLVKTYLRTGSATPYCRHHYRVTIKISASEKSKAHRGEIGSFYLMIRGEKASNSGRMRLSERDIYFKPGSVHTWVVDGSPVGRFLSAKIEWVYSLSLLNPVTWRLGLPSIHLAWMKVETLESTERMTMCTESQPLVTKKPVYFSIDQSGPCKRKTSSFSWFGQRQSDDENDEDEDHAKDVKKETEEKKTEKKSKWPFIFGL